MPPDLDEAGSVTVGTIVRVPLHGRRVGGWVVDDHVEPEVAPGSLRALVAVVGAGPSEEMVALTRWSAWRWAGPRATFLRAASPPNLVPVQDDPERRIAVFPAVEPPVALTAVAPHSPRLVQWPPAVDRTALVRSLLAEEGSTIVVVPDGDEARRLEVDLASGGRDVRAVHGDAPAAVRTDQWREQRRGACVVLGGRIAAFAPVPDLRAVVILDDADEALQEERAPTWHARDLLVERATRCGAPVTFVTPAPTVDASAAAGAPARPSRAVEREGWPVVEIADRRDEPPGAGIAGHALGPALRRALAQDLDGVRGRALCVLNRRGRATVLACRSCRELARCEHCGAAVREGTSLHGTSDALVCPSCATERPLVCLHCGGTRFHAVRPGVGRARDDVAGLVPHARVVALDASSAGTSDAGGVDADTDADVVVGTEAAFHRIRGELALVAFLDFDQELLAPRFRAAEQALWLLVRAARMVGPRHGHAGEQTGRVLLQTRVPDHEVVQAAVHGDPTPVIEAETARRRALDLPPFGGIAELGGAEVAVVRACELLRPHVEVRGPTGAHALLRAPSAAALSDALDAVDLAPARALGRLRVAVDAPRI